MAAPGVSTAAVSTAAMSAAAASEGPRRAECAEEAEREQGRHEGRREMGSIRVPLSEGEEF